MTFLTRKAAFSGLALIGASALVLTGCAAAPEGDDETDAASDFLPCMVSDSGGFDDHSFNELGLAGLTAAADELGVEPKSVESASEDDYAPNIDSLVAEGCNLVVTVGFPILFFPFSRTIWVAIDLAMRPLELHEGVAPLWELEGDRQVLLSERAAAAAARNLHRKAGDREVRPDER